MESVAREELPVVIALKKKSIMAYIALKKKSIMVKS